MGGRKGCERGDREGRKVEKRFEVRSKMKYVRRKKEGGRRKGEEQFPTAAVEISPVHSINVTFTYNTHRARI